MRHKSQHQTFKINYDTNSQLSPQLTCVYLNMSAVRRRKSCSCWSLPELIPRSIMARRGSSKPRTRGLPACRATNTSIRSNTYKSKTMGRERSVFYFSPSLLLVSCCAGLKMCLTGLSLSYLDLKLSDQRLLLL